MRNDDRDVRSLFDGLWRDGDPWSLDDSELDQARYRRQIALLADRRYGRALEVGCAAGSFTRFLAPLCDSLLAVDIAEDAVGRAKATAPAGVTIRRDDVMEMDLDAEGPWDLIVMTEAAYYLGWAHPMYDVGWLAHTMLDATARGGRLLLANTIDVHKDTSIMSPWLIQTYRDLFVNTGYLVEREETMGGVKDTVSFDILMTLLQKPVPS